MYIMGSGVVMDAIEWLEFEVDPSCEDDGAEHDGFFHSAPWPLHLQIKIIIIQNKSQNYSMHIEIDDKLTYNSHV